MSLLIDKVSKNSFIKLCFFVLFFEIQNEIECTGMPSSTSESLPSFRGRPLSYQFFADTPHHQTCNLN